MTENPPTVDPTEPGGGPAHRVRLPGFIVDEEIGLGDAIKRATVTLGLKHCGGCARRAAALDRWLVFSGGQSR